VNNQ